MIGSRWWPCGAAVHDGVQSVRFWILPLGLCAATAMLVWSGHQASRESKRNLRSLLSRHQTEQLALLWAGVAQDMKAAHATVLVPVTAAQLILDPPYDLADAFATGFARFSYPESFFAWKPAANGNGDLIYVFNRANRPPPWHAEDRLSGPYPVVVVRSPAAVRPIVDEVRRQERFDRPFAVFETTVAGVPYQVIARLIYSADEPGRLFGVVGFTVNLAWVRQHYYDELTRQIGQIGGEPDEVVLEIADESGHLVTSNHSRNPGIPVVERRFPLIFVDRVLLGSVAPADLRISTWTARVGIAASSQLAAAAAAPDITFILTSIAAVATVIALLATARSVRMAAELAAMKSDFVASITHELKTPLSLITLIADTLAAGRYESPQTIHGYAKLLSRRSQDLTRLIDNLLAYARLSDTGHAYVFEPVGVEALIDDAIEQFHPRLIEQAFKIELDVAPGLPAVRADRPSLLLALDNLIDNAIKYSGAVREIRIQAHAEDNRVAVSVSDRGAGIRADEVTRVCDKFYRGRSVKSGGSGLGLAIARQIVEAAGGRLRIESTWGAGTQVRLDLPVMT